MTEDRAWKQQTQRLTLCTGSSGAALGKAQLGLTRAVPISYGSRAQLYDPQKPPTSSLHRCLIFIFQLVYLKKHFTNRIFLE